MKIVIDTNALENDRYARRPVADAAWRGAAAGDFELVVPEAVISELVKHFPEVLQETIDDLNAALKKRKRELETFGLEAPEPPSIDVAALSEAYEAELRARSAEPGCSVHPHPGLGPAVAWAVTRRKPFDSNGHGLPDAAIWLTVLELADDDEVTLVTNNSKDFGGPGQLRPELRGDLRDRDIPDDRVRIVEDLFALRREIVQPAAEASARVGRLLEEPTTGLNERLIDALRQSSVEVGAAELDFDLDEPPTIADLAVDSFEVVDARELGDDEILARLVSRGDLLLEMVVFRSDYVDAEYAGVSLDAFDPDVNAFAGELWVSADLTIDAVVRLDGTVEEASIQAFERLPLREEMQRRLDGDAGERLIHELHEGRISWPTVSGYRPPEPIASSVEEATLEDWRADGELDVEEVVDRGPDGTLLSVGVGAIASITWLVSAPLSTDLDRFGALAEGVEHGGGFLHDLASEEPVVIRLTAQLGVEGWEDIEVVEVKLRPEVRDERAAEALEDQDE